ncbi:MAG: BREX-1 system adenine-specific DNA-methyltransferase PglX [Parasporobacterium sp.]|nr:BREX-1 system adenine-specific DNA-methyltransferase PglX [Parasporobacterium sp.]
MNKSAIRNFAIEARNNLIKSAITEAGFYGITKEEIKSPIQKGNGFEVYETLTGAEKRIFGSDIRRRAALVEAIRQKGFDEVIEETAYTWFNRLIAIRFMEVNNYLPFRMRVLSSDSGSLTPDIVSRSIEVDLNLTDRELDAIQKAKDENSYDEAFRLLFIKACNELNDILPGLFKKTDDYMELLLKLPYTSDGVVRMLVDTIPESNFNVNEGGQVEIIGWLYQYYNTEPKAKAFAKKGKISKEEIPAVTQLFTPDWIVRYMVENSLGRLWVEHLLANGDSRSEHEIVSDFGWKYYLPEAEQEPEVQAQLMQIHEERKDLTPEDILCIDPCQGSGHILVYLFDVLMQIYREDGYSERDAARSILEHNLYGLDIDDRAYQLSYFAVMMKARQYNRRILKGEYKPNVYSIQESNGINRNHLKYFGAGLNDFEKNNAITQMTGILDTFRDAKEYGSILAVNQYDWDLLDRFIANIEVIGQLSMYTVGLDDTANQLKQMIAQGKILAQKYNVTTTNPPYMSISNGSENLNVYVKDKYPYSKVDLFAVFIERCLQFAKCHGYVAMITMHSWMFLSSFESLRNNLRNITIVAMNHLGARAFDEIGGEVVQTTSFILRKSHLKKYKGTFYRLTKPTSETGKKELFLKGTNPYIVEQDSFEMIPSAPIAYWASDNLKKGFSEGKNLELLAHPRKGLATTDNNRFLRLWFEIGNNNMFVGCRNKEEGMQSSKKWFPLNKGGEYRKWYGNKSYVINWQFDGREMKDAVIERYHGGSYTKEIRSEDKYFKNSITWSALTTGTPSFRYSDYGALFDSAGSSMFPDDNKAMYLLGLLNSKVVDRVLDIINPTLNFGAGSIANIPVLYGNMNKAEDLASENVRLSKSDWDSFETSWDFEGHPLVKKGLGFKHRNVDNVSIEECFESWSEECDHRFEQIKANEEELNQIFIDVYGLHDELTPEVDDKDVTVRRADVHRDIKSLLSYAAGCMFGRYSLDVEGLAYAGGDWKEAYSIKYKTFIPDEDAIIPITDEEYFKDDIVARFVDFIRIVYGEKTLEENLNYIADALGNKGDTSRAVIRNYFLNDFYKDHCNTYSVTGSGKRPIYWLFDSGKQNGFKALIYIHRYTPDTVGLIRSVYLHSAQAAIQNSLQNSEYIIATTTSATERAQETRKRDKYVKQLNELRPYYQALSHIALQRINLDLDDGVRKNYQLFQGVEVSTEGKKKQTIDLLAKI